MGISWQEFWTLNPRIIRLLIKGHEEKIKEQDYLAWLFNQYTLSAVSVAVEHCLMGRKAKSKYFKTPFLREVESRNKPVTEDEIQIKREIFVENLKAMERKFKLNNRERKEASHEN